MSSHTVLFVVACLLVIDHLAVSCQVCLVSVVWENIHDLYIFSNEEQCWHWVHFVIPLLIDDLYLTRLCASRYCTACSRASSLHSSAVNPFWARAQQNKKETSLGASTLPGALYCMLSCQHRMRSHTETVTRSRSGLWLRLTICHG